MADSPPQSFNKTHLHEPNSPSSPSSPFPNEPSKSKFPYFFTKSLILILVLLVFSFFPSQVPDFFKKTIIINKIWDLIYLLVVGIAVCYGLFTRKVNRVYSNSDEDIGSKESYLSGIAHISSIFENEIKNSYGFEEKDLFERSEFGKSDGKKAKLNQYFLGESLVVINDEKYVLEQLGKPKTIQQNQALKSLDVDSRSGISVVKDRSNDEDEMKRSKIRGLVPIKLEEKFKETNSHSHSHSDSDSDSDSDSRTLLNFRSKLTRLEKQEDICLKEANKSSRITHSLDVLDEKDLFERSEFGKSDGKKANLNQYFLGESSVVVDDEKYVLEQLGKPKTIEQIQALKSLDFDSRNGKSVVKDCSSDEDGINRSNIRGLVPIKLKERFKETNSNSNSDSRTPLNWRSKSLRLEKREDTCLNEANKSSRIAHSVGVLDFKSVRSKSMKSSLPLPEKEPRDMGKTSFMDSKTQESSIASSSKTNNQSSSEESLKDFSSTNIKDSNHGIRKEPVNDFFENCTFHPIINSKCERSSVLVSSETNLETSEPVSGKSDSSSLVPKPVPIYKKGKSVRTNRLKEQVLKVKVKPDDKVETESKPVSIATNVNLDETRIVDDDLSDTEARPGEVDRKADEFIAKFREQIRLQRAASARRSTLR